MTLKFHNYKRYKVQSNQRAIVVETGGYQKARQIAENWARIGDRNIRISPLDTDKEI